MRRSDKCIAVDICLRRWMMRLCCARGKSLNPTNHIFLFSSFDALANWDRFSPMQFVQPAFSFNDNEAETFVSSQPNTRKKHIDSICMSRIHADEFISSAGSELSSSALFFDNTMCANRFQFAKENRGPKALKREWRVWGCAHRQKSDRQPTRTLETWLKWEMESKRCTSNNVLLAMPFPFLTRSRLLRQFI